MTDPREMVAFVLLIAFGVYWVATALLTGTPLGFVVWPVCDVLGIDTFAVCD